MHTLYDLFGLNQPLFFAVNGGHGVVVDHLMLLGSLLGDFWNLPWVVGAAAILYAVQASPKLAPRVRCLPERDTISRFLLAFLAGYALAALFVALLKLGLQMPRPPLAMPSASIRILGEPETSYSFPSGHSAFAMLLAAALWPHCRVPLRALLVFFVAWVGISRIGVGAHFPVDVITGYLCGVFSAWIAMRALSAHSSESAQKPARAG